MSISMHALAGVSLLVLASPALAETGADPADIVVTAERAVEAAQARIERTPGGVDLVPAADFADRLAVSFRDALAFSPGVYTQPRFGQEVRISVRGSGISRGFHMRGLMLFQDGVPINLADNNGDFQELDPQVFQHIEVLRGGNALSLGGSTLGGAINAVTPTGRTAPGVELRVDGGSFGTVRGKAAAGFADDRADAWLAITGDRSDGDRDHASRRALRFNGNVGIRLNEAIETRFYASVNHIRQDLPGSLTRSQALTDPAQAAAASVSGDQARNIDSIRLQNRTTVDLGGATLTGGVFLNLKQLDHPIFQVIDQKSTDYGAFARIDWAGDVAGLPVEATMGSNARFGRVAARQFANLSGRRGTQTAEVTQRARTIDSYGELRVSPLPALSLIAGGVWSSGRREVDNQWNPLRSGKAEFDMLSPKFGLLYAPSPAVQLFANYSRSVELPGYSELNQTPFAGAGAPGFVDVDAQKAWTIEFGTRGQMGIAAWDISFYRADLRGEMLQYDAGNGAGIPAATFNAGRTRHQGIEAGLTLDLAGWARLRQVYQLNDFRFRHDVIFGDNRLPVVARHLYRAELRIGSDRMSVRPNVEWVPQGAWADYANTTRAAGYALIGLAAEAAVDERVTVFADLRNLAGKKAIGDVSAVTLATANSSIWYPVERRAFYGGVRARF